MQWRVGTAIDARLEIFQRMHAATETSMDNESDMRTTLMANGLLVALAMMIVMPNRSLAHEPPVLQVITIEKDVNRPPFLEEVRNLREVAIRLAPDVNFQVWDGYFAGSYSGVLSVLIEYPSFAVMAATMNNWHADSDYMRLAPVLSSAGGNVQANSLLVDVTPFPVAKIEVTKKRSTGAVMMLVPVQLTGDIHAYLALLERLNGVAQRVAPDAKMRVWQGFLSGSNTGMISVLVEYQSMAKMVAINDVLQIDPDWLGIMEELESSGREILARSLLKDVTMQ